MIHHQSPRVARAFATHMCAAAIAAAASSTCLAQEAPQAKLKPADAVLRSLPPRVVERVRELSDGRVIFQMMTPAKPNSAERPNFFMAVADMRTGHIDSIPGMPLGDAIAFAADTSLVRSSGGWVFVKNT